MRINDVPISTKLWSLVVALLLATTAVTVLLQQSARRIHDESTAKLRSADELITLVTQWRMISQRNTDRTLATHLNRDDADSAFFAQRLKDGIAESSDLQKRIGELAQSDRDKAQAEQMQEKRKAVLAVIPKIGALRKQGDMDGARKLVEQEFMPALAGYDKAQLDMLKLQESKRDEALAQAQASLDRNATWAVVQVVSVLLVALAATALLLRSIVGPLGTAVASAERIATGDLRQTHVVDRRDEVGRLMDAMNAMGQKLRNVVHEVRQGVEMVDSASSEIAAGNLDLSNRTERTASSLQQTASNLHEATASAQKSNQIATQADQLASEARDSAIQSGQVVAEVVARMEEITVASRKIADITGVIDGIAFQTNILALNAAVEAARAGEQGRGFAVVASEVRTLAQRSGEAAREIKALIAQSSETVEAGSRQVGVAKSVIDGVVTGVQAVAGLIANASAASVQQCSGLEKINHAVSHIDQVTQQNAALVEEAAAAAASLRDQSKRLALTVSVFKTEG